jgi:histidinol-phosphate phosphatase family protein
LNQKPRGLILMDRDGVLNRLVIDAEQGTVDSPLAPRQVQMMPKAAQAVRRLNGAGYGIAIVSNQPAAAKRKTTRKNLMAVHGRILKNIRKAGGKVLSSHLCFHKAEDRCSCRKPRTGLLKDAFRQNPGYPRRASWLIGDGLTDIQAGRAMGVKTVLLARHKCDTCQLAIRKHSQPTLWADDLWSAVHKILCG